MKLFCECCQAEREADKLTDGTYHCRLCFGPVICTDCGAFYTDNCGPGSVYVPAVIERTYQTVMEFTVVPVPPQKCEKPTNIKDRQGARCENAEGPEYKYMGKDYHHKCVFHRDHEPAEMHYAFVQDGDGVMTWFRWGVEYA